MIAKSICIALLVFLGLAILFDLGIKASPSGNKGRSKGVRRLEIKKITAFRQRVSTLLQAINSRHTEKDYFQLTLLLVISGVFIGSLYNNLILGIVLAAGLPFFQYQMLLKKKVDVKRQYDEKLEICMSMVTNSYMQSEDIESAIIDSYSRMDSSEPAVRPFEAFIGQSAGNADIRQCLLDMKTDCDNEYFHQWCDKLALCRDNSRLKYVLPSIIGRMRRRRTLDSETLTECYGYLKDFVLVCAMGLFLTLVVPILTPIWKNIVREMLLGKVLTAIVLIVMFAAIAYVVKVVNPAGDRL